MVYPSLLLLFASVAQAAPTVAPPQPQAAGAPARQSRLFPLPDEAVAYVPASAGAGPPLLVLLHGAGHGQAEMVRHFEGEADRRGIVLLAPDSHGDTWDAVSLAEQPPSIYSPLGREMAHSFSASRDARRVEAAIAALRKIVPVDPARVVLAGFSDGATFALAMGLSRDYPFAAVIAWSPGIAIQTARPVRGRKVFVSHGRQDPMLAFQATCSDIVPMLRNEGAQVTFLAFDGGHDAPPAVKDAFLDAAFGPVPGDPPHLLPTKTETCMRPAAEMPDLPH